MKKTIKNTIMMLGTVAAVLFFGWVFMHALFWSSASDITATQAQAASLPSSATPSADLPVSLSIPAIGVHAKIQGVGVTSDGKMAVPNNFTDVGWYQYGTVPGQVGSAVIAGHVDDGLALPAVFINLDELKPGDNIYITTKGNQSLDFVVTGSKAYDRNATDTAGIFDNDSGRILNLITCTGTWLPAQKTHNERLVVTAVLKQ